MAEQIINYELTICIDSCRRPYHRFGVHIESRGIRRGNRRCIPHRGPPRAAPAVRHAGQPRTRPRAHAQEPSPQGHLVLRYNLSSHGTSDQGARTEQHGRARSSMAGSWRGAVAQHVIGRRRFLDGGMARISDSASTVLTIAYRALGLPRARHSYSSTLI